MAALTPTVAQVLLISGRSSKVLADSTITPGMPLRYAPTTGKWGIAQSDNDVTDAGWYGLAIALSGGGAGQEITIAESGAIVDLGAGAAAAAGTIYVPLAAAGTMGPTADLTTSGQYRGIAAIGVGSNRVFVLGVPGAVGLIP